MPIPHLTPLPEYGLSANIHLCTSWRAYGIMSLLKNKRLKRWSQPLQCQCSHDRGADCGKDGRGTHSTDRGSSSSSPGTPGDFCMERRHTHIHASIHTFIQPHWEACPSTFIHTHIDTYIHPYIRIYIHTHKKHTHTHAHTYRHTYIHTCVHTYILTYLALLPGPRFSTSVNTNM